MKKLLTIICSLMMALSLCACSTSSNTGIDTEPTTVKDYLEKYEYLMYTGSEKGMCYVLDDDSEYGLALAVSLTSEQLEKMDELDFFSDSYDDNLKAIVEESNTFTVTALDNCVPDMSMYDKYVGQKLAVLFDEGYSEMSTMISTGLSTVELDNGTYDVVVAVEESIAQDQEMNEEFERTLTAKSFEFSGWGDDFYNSLYK